MSRKYCDRCGDKHDNGGLGMCDDCLEIDEAEKNDAKSELNRIWTEFLEKPEEDRWEAVFDFMYEKGWRP